MIAKISYGELRKGEIELNGRKVATGSLSSYNMALEIAEILKDEITKGDFLLSQPISNLPRAQSMVSLETRGQNR